MNAISADVSIAVVGSVNLDLIARVEAFPEHGETVTDAALARHPGGKGGNQALAARRLGAMVYLVACTGDDATADEALATLRAEGVDLSLVRPVAGSSTGVAMIVVNAEGENQIVVAPGANRRFTPGLLALPECDGVIAQLEVPMDTLVEVAGRSKSFFCLNAAPARAVPAELLARTDLLVVNEIEAERIGPKLKDYRGWLAVTYGAAGAELLRDGERVAKSDAPRVDTIDTVGAGDAFTAALTLGLVCGQPPETVLARACAAGALATTRPGAQSSPTAAELDRLLTGGG